MEFFMSKLFLTDLKIKQGVIQRGEGPWDSPPGIVLTLPHSHYSYYIKYFENQWCSTAYMYFNQDFIKSTITRGGENAVNSHFGCLLLTAKI